eukprot:TRINITY_DN23799_c1_g1_i1.p2 TRINITY_DN23799_c1_g1~~TRINITY_DN23799_c1_g1_i1.p2  ORF type:complete len:276 (+),score=-15.42 TRINITY_DN23799_c1_g1_i1:38-829(+)
MQCTSIFYIIYNNIIYNLQQYIHKYNKQNKIIHKIQIIYYFIDTLVLLLFYTYFYFFTTIYQKNGYNQQLNIFQYKYIVVTNNQILLAKTCQTITTTKLLFKKLNPALQKFFLQKDYLYHYHFVLQNISIHYNHLSMQVGTISAKSASSVRLILADPRAPSGLVDVADNGHQTSSCTQEGGPNVVNNLFNSRLNVVQQQKPSDVMLIKFPSMQPVQLQSTSPSENMFNPELLYYNHSTKIFIKHLPVRKKEARTSQTTCLTLV